MGLWKKRGSGEGEPSDVAHTATPSLPQPELRPSAVERSSSSERRAAPERGGGSGKVANIGRSISIVGDVTGDEDLVIDGRVQGSVELKGQLTIGAGGDITGEVRAKQLTVLGRLTGNAVAGERVEVGSTGRLHGDIDAPRLLLQDGAQVNGKVNMKAPQPQPAAPAPAPGAAARKPEAKPADGHTEKELVRSGPALPASSAPTTSATPPTPATPPTSAAQTTPAASTTPATPPTPRPH